MKMRQESVNTADGTTAQADPSSLPVPLEPPVIKRQASRLGETKGTYLGVIYCYFISLKQAVLLLLNGEWLQILLWPCQFNFPNLSSSSSLFSNQCINVLLIIDDTVT